MQQLTQLALDTRHFLESFHPLAPWFFLAFACWASVLFIRKQFPKAWLLLEKLGPPDHPASQIVQALPSILAGAAVAALGSGGDPWIAVQGAAFAALAPIGHHIAKALPFLPYTGAASEVTRGED